LIPRGDHRIWDYGRGLNTINLYSHLRPGANARTITFLLGSVDDGFWRAQTVQIESPEEVERCFELLKVTVNGLLKLPNENDLLALLQAAVDPYEITAEFD
jgi:hypothetical protein